MNIPLNAQKQNKFNTKLNKLYKLIYIEDAFVFNEAYLKKAHN
jgi:hypothetical protein